MVRITTKILIIWCLALYLNCPNISVKSVQNFSSYFANKHTDKRWSKHILLGGGNNPLVYLLKLLFFSVFRVHFYTLAHFDYFCGKQFVQKSWEWFTIHRPQMLDVRCPIVSGLLKTFWARLISTNHIRASSVLWKQVDLLLMRWPKCNSLNRTKKGKRSSWVMVNHWN